jgi:hypothetical protein
MTSSLSLKILVKSEIVLAHPWIVPRFRIFSFQIEID